MKNLFFVVLILVLCNCGKSDKPDYLLSKEQMVGLQMDFQILDEKIGALRVSKDSGNSIYLVYSDSIYKKHGVTKEVYLQNYDFYINHSEEFIEIYEAVVDSLSLEERLTNIEQ